MRLRLPLLLLLLVGCTEDGGNVLCTRAVYDPATGVVRDFGVTAAAKKVESFLATSSALVKAALEIDQQMLAACKQLGADLGVPPAEMAPLAGQENTAGAATQAACTRVKDEIAKILAENLPKTSHLSIVSTPPACDIDAAAQLKCEQECEPVTVTATQVQCKPGKIYGQCSAMCMGSCVGSCAGKCEGQCAATCTGSCSGTCVGKCEGTCATKNMRGDCIGACTGKCTGTCEGKCSGGCSGSCSGSCMASCDGECHGGCTGEFTLPKCEEVQTQVEVQECKTSCDARARLEAKCSKPELKVDFGVDVTAAQKAKLDLLVAALVKTYPTVLQIGHRVGTVIQSSVDGFSASLNGLGASVNEAGLQAAACVVAAGAAIVDSLTQIEVSVSVTVSITGSVTANGGL